MFRPAGALKSTGDASSSARAEVMAAAETSLLSAELVRAYGMEGPEASVFREAVARSSRANKARKTQRKETSPFLVSVHGSFAWRCGHLPKGDNDAADDLSPSAPPSCFSSSQEACRLGELLGGITSFISALSLIAVVWAGSVEAFAGRLTAGDLIAFVYYCAEIGNSTEKTFRIYSELMALSGSLDRVAGLIGGGAEGGASATQRGSDTGAAGGRAVSIPLGTATGAAAAAAAPVAARAAAAAAAAATATAAASGGDDDQWTMIGTAEEGQQAAAAERSAAGRRSQGAASITGRSPSPPPRAGRSHASPGAAPPSPSTAAAQHHQDNVTAPTPPLSPGGSSRLPHAVELSDVWFRYGGGGCVASPRRSRGGVCPTPLL